MSFTPDQIAELAMLELRASGANVPADNKALLKLYVDQAVALLGSNGYDPTTHAPDQAGVACKAFAVWQYLTNTGGVGDRAYTTWNYERLKWTRDAARAFHRVTT